MERSELRKKGILMLTPFYRPNIGGVETHLDDLCEYLRNNEYNVFVNTYQPLTTKESGKPVEKKKNLEIRRMGWFGHNLFPKFEPYPLIEFIYLTPGLLLFSLFFMLRNHKKIDLIHAHGFNGALIAKILSKVFRKKSVVSTHAVYNFSEGSLFAKNVRWVLSSFDKIIALTDLSKNDILTTGIPEEKITTYCHWVDQEMFSPMDKKSCRKKLNLKDNFHVLFIGRYIEKKGILVLVKASKKFDEKVKFIFIGDGPLLNEIEQLSKKQKNIINIGPINGPRIISQYYNSADVFVVPSLYDEPFGRVVAESLSCGTPVIVSKRGSLPTIVDKSVGFIVEPNSKNISGAIKTLNEDPKKLKELEKKCRKYALDNFGLKNAELFDNIYTELISK